MVELVPLGMHGVDQNGGRIILGVRSRELGTRVKQVQYQRAARFAAGEVRRASFDRP